MARKKARKKSKKDSNDLLSLWKDTRVPGALSSAQYFYRGLKDKGLTGGKSQSQVKNLLQKDLYYQVSSGLRKHFPQRHDRVFGWNARWEGDLGDLGGRFRDVYRPRKLKGRYYLLLIEIFSRKLFCRALADKAGATVLAALKDIAAHDLSPPYSLANSTLETDAGKEFVNRPMALYLKSNNVFHSVSAARNKAR